MNPEVFITIAIGFLIFVLIYSLKTSLGNRKLSWKEKYQEDLKTDLWKRKREKILKRDNYKCQWCGSTKELQVHHKYYEKYHDGRVNAWDYPDRCLITLCKRCHEKCHQKYKVKTYYIKRGIHYYEA